MTQGKSRGLHTSCHCEEGAERETRQSTEWNRDGQTIRYDSQLTVDRHGLRTRDNKAVNVRKFTLHS
ncbi:hypothetical protein OAV71_05035 [Opitutales bacterium]|nr:hypothetical protein [Opitutales bacterium]